MNRSFIVGIGNGTPNFTGTTFSDVIAWCTFQDGAGGFTISSPADPNEVNNLQLFAKRVPIEQFDWSLQMANAQTLTGFAGYPYTISLVIDFYQ